LGEIANAELTSTSSIESGFANESIAYYPAKAIALTKPHTNPATQRSEIYCVIGQEGFTRLIAAFYRQVPTDDVLGPLYPKEDLAGAEERLRLFLLQRFGGPQTYSQSRGHPRLRMRHTPFAITKAARTRWLELMHNAFREAKLPAEVEALLGRYFNDTATFLLNQPDQVV
jgi:hemoglobin